MLEKEYKSTLVELEPVKQDFLKHGCTLVSDGWSNVQARPLVNFVAVSPKGEMFLDSIDTTGKIKDAKYISELLCQKVEEIGMGNVIQIVMDSAACNVASLSKVGKKYAHVTRSPW